MTQLRAGVNDSQRLIKDSDPFQRVFSLTENVLE